MNWLEVLKGVQLCLGVQLVLIAFFLFSSKQTRNHLLGYYTALICVSSLSSALYYYLEKVPMISFLFGAHLIIFHAPILFLYIYSLNNKSFSSKWHFLFPLCYTFTYLFIRLEFPDFFDAHNIKFLIVHLIVTVLYTSTYFYFGFNFFKKKLNEKLKQKAYKKFRVFYVITNFHAIGLYMIMAVSYLSYFFFHETYLYFNENIVPHIFESIVYLNPITSIIFIVYLLSETNSFQSLILNKEITRSHISTGKKLEISKQINQIIDADKRFLDSKFTITELSNEIGVGSKELAEFFNEEWSISFIDYINKKRIKNFKTLITGDTSDKFSMEGMAQLSGFKSKATFYRVFKKFEGITPTEYKNRIKL